MQSDAYTPADALKHAADKGEFKGHQVAKRAVSIRRDRRELYDHFRRFSNLAGFMENIERVDELDATRSHWVVKAPAGQTVEWDAVVTEDRPGELIAWVSEPGADIVNSGAVEFRDAPHGRGTEVHATLVYDAPGGEFGKLIAQLFQHEPGQQAKRDLRRFKMLMEAGEIATTDYPDAAPRYKKSDAAPEDRRAETR